MCNACVAQIKYAICLVLLVVIATTDSRPTIKDKAKSDGQKDLVKMMKTVKGQITKAHDQAVS